MYVCVCACMRVCVRACVRACVHLCVSSSGILTTDTPVYLYAVLHTMHWSCVTAFNCSCVYKPVQFFKQAGLPGPKPKPFIGNLDLVRKFSVSLGMACVLDYDLTVSPSACVRFWEKSVEWNESTFLCATHEGFVCRLSLAWLLRCYRVYRFGWWYRLKVEAPRLIWIDHQGDML